MRLQRIHKKPIRNATEFNALIKEVKASFAGWGDPNSQSGLKIQKEVHAYMPADLGGASNCVWAVDRFRPMGLESALVQTELRKAPTFTRCFDMCKGVGISEFTGLFWERSYVDGALETRVYGEGWEIEYGRSCVIVFRCEPAIDKEKDFLLVSVLYWGHSGDHNSFCSLTPHWNQSKKNSNV